jgi:hypothetical protein
MATQVDFDYDGPPVTVSNGMAVQVFFGFGLYFLNNHKKTTSSLSHNLAPEMRNTQKYNFKKFYLKKDGSPF